MYTVFVPSLTNALEIARQHQQTIVYDATGKKDIPVTFDVYHDCIVCLQRVKPFEGAYTLETGILAHKGACYKTRNAELSRR